MKIHIKETIKRNIEFMMFVGVVILFSVSISINLISIFRAKSLMIIAIDANGTRVITSEKDPIYRTEALKFIQRFLTSVYNFQGENFVKQMGFATNVMSNDLWEKKRAEIMALKDRIDRDQISVQGNVQRLTVDETGTYFALLKVVETSRLSKGEHAVKVTLKLKAVERTLDNPAGLVVDEYEEETLSN